MSKITLNDVESFQNESTASSIINTNSSVIQAAMDNTLSRDGTSPNQMDALLDMNSNPIINLPAPTSNYMPLRLIDAETLNGGGTIVTSPLPVGGTTGQVLAKNSNTNYDVIWSSTVAGGAGGAINSIQYNNIGAFGGITLGSGQILQGTGTTPVAILPVWVDVTTLGVDNTGVSVTSSALQSAITTITSANKVVYIPNGTYNMGGDSLTIPDNSVVFCQSNATIVRTAEISNVTTRLYGDYTCCMISIGNNVRWYGGILKNTEVLGTSTTSQTVGTGTFTFTTQAGLPIVPTNTFLRAWSNFNPSLRMEGSVTSYSGSTLIINFPFSGGTGSASDWNFTYGGVYQCPMVLHGVKGSTIDGVSTSGNWYVGIMIDGWNPPAGGTLTANNNTIQNCKAYAIQNRPFYMYGTCWHNTFLNCYASGFSSNGFPGVSDYGFNMNPANTGTVNTQQHNKIIGCTVDSTSAQGYVMGDLCIYNTIEGCIVNNLQDPAGTGFGIEQANGNPTGTNVPQYNLISNCMANNCQGSGFLSTGSLYTQFVGCKAVVCGNGFYLGPNTSNSTFVSCNSCHAIGNTNGFNLLTSNHCDLIGIAAIANTVGVVISSGSTVTIASGRSISNTVNVSDNGTSTQNSLVTF